VRINTVSNIARESRWPTMMGIVTFATVAVWLGIFCGVSSNARHRVEYAAPPASLNDAHGDPRIRIDTHDARDNQNLMRDAGRQTP